MVSLKKRDQNLEETFTLQLQRSLQLDNDDAITVHDEPLEDYDDGKPHYFKVSIICCLISVCGLSVGWDVALIGSFLNMENFQERFGQYHPHSNTYAFDNIRTGLISGFYNLAAMVGCSVIPLLSTHIGKRKNMIFGAIAYIVGAVVFISANDNWCQVFIARLIMGFAIGGLSVLAPSLVAEIAPVDIRGVLLSLYQILSCFGLAFGDILCYGTNFLNNSLQWRIPLIFTLLWQLSLLVGLILMPESQSYLIQKGEFDKAFKSMKSLYRGKNDKEIDMMLQNLKEEFKSSKENKVDFNYILHGKPKILQRIVSGMLIQFFQAFTGINYFFYYSTTIFKGVGMSSSFVASIILTTVYAISSIISLPLMKKFKRKTIMLTGSVFIVIWLILFVLLSTLLLYPNGDLGPSSVIIGKLVIMCSCFYIFTFSLSWGPLAYVIINEIVPLKLNKTAVGFAMSVNWGSTFLISFFTPFITNKIGFNYGYVFFGCSFASFFYVLFFIPETSGYTFDQIDQMYEKNMVFLRSKIIRPEEIELPAFKEVEIFNDNLGFDDATPMNDFVYTSEEDTGDYFAAR